MATSSFTKPFVVSKNKSEEFTRVITHENSKRLIQNFDSKLLSVRDLRKIKQGQFSK